MLATKLYIPPPRPTVIPRARLLRRLDAGLRGKLTLVAAPAGFGKTTLVSSWVAALGACPVAWLALDAGDNDPLRFLTYLVAAFRTVTPVSEELLAFLQSPQAPRTLAGYEAILTQLLNALAARPVTPAPAATPGCVLVLDDYHVIEGQGPHSTVDQALSFFLDYLPAQVHVVITTRADPHLPLARLRARGQLTEVRAADLRFTPAEAAEFLNQVMELNLAAADVARLEARTEGWIAGLQLAALSLQGHPDGPGFIRAFAGDHRYIVDYLVAEVLQQQPAPLRQFLLQTAILDRLSGPLCDAVTGQQGSGAQLEALERGNFFVVPLDDRRHWYRYHHLFADMLHAHLQAEQPEQVATLHRRASAWYAQQRLTAEAIHHALAAADFALAAELIELALPTLRQQRQEGTLLGWLQQLPAAVLHYRPVLSLHYAGTLLQCGERTGIAERLQEVEQWLALGTAASAEALSGIEEHPHPLLIVDPGEFRRLPGWLATYRAAYALIHGDVQATLTYAQQALDRMPADEHFGRGAATALLGLADWTRGELAAAYQTYAAGMARLQQAGHITDAIGGALALADIRMTQGRLHAAMAIYEEALQLAAAQHPGEPRPRVRGTADMYVGLSELYLERNELQRARAYLQQSQELGEHRGFPQNPYRWRVAMARLQQAEGDLAAALALLQEAERRYVSDFYPNVRPVAALQTRVWLAQGRLDDARAWVREQGLAAADELSYLREFEYITLARVLLAQQRRDHSAQPVAEATHLLERLFNAAEAGGRRGHVIEILVLLALAYQAQGNRAAALPPLTRALTLAEPEGYLRSFVAEGAPMATLLQAAAIHTEGTAVMHAYIDKLLTTLGAESPALPPQAARPQPAPAQRLSEPLSDRELDVLRLFKTELSGPEIAQHLMIGLSTVRTHTKSIFRKLDVNQRRAAVNRATELGLI